MASIFGTKCKCKDCKHEFEDRQAKAKDVGAGEADIEYVCPKCESENWDYK